MSGTDGTSSGVYRPDIDGLRAVAVLSVLFFHVGFAPFAGGCLGVDVFLVISGYLITRLIVQQVDQGAFSLRQFYLRRARRLLPALLCVTVVTLVAAAVILPPVLLKEFGGSVVFSSLSLSNVYFYRLADYFDTSAINKPLLHTWSLSLEEQFYLFWPVTLLLARRVLSRQRTGVVLLLVGSASLLLTMLFIARTSAVFYLVPFRGFEFAIGGLLVWLHDERQRLSNAAREIAAVVGLTLIVLSVLAYTPQALNDLRVLLPCLGAALVILGGEARVAGILLRNPVAVGIGRISYSLYLVHWPLVVFLKYRTLDDFTSREQWLLVLYSFVAAILLYTFVEVPFRHRNPAASRPSDRRFVFAYAASLALVLGVSAHMWRTDGWLWRYPSEVRQQLSAETLDAYKHYTHQLFERSEHAFANDGRPRVLVVGDSQASDFVNVLGASGRLARYDVTALRLPMQCQALISFSAAQFDQLSTTDRAACEPGFRALTDGSRLTGAETVVLAFNWDERGVRQIDEAVRHVHGQGVGKVFVVGRKSQGLGGPDLVLRHGMADVEAFSATRKNRIAWQANGEIAALRSPFVYIDIMSTICSSASTCAVFGDAHDMILFDGTHFTPSGARYVGQLLAASGQLDF